MRNVRHQDLGDFCACYLTEDLTHLGLMLSRLALMVQAAVMDGQFIDLLSLSDISAYGTH